ncbi:UNVERIFIED_CONTAM: Calcium-binding component of the spindle pole body (SPB) half-bridge [Siphonaria sp. JEL0065]|nr:Calcium-binding component of the spindle pole body (SPB) half-bridge [Siphonaria sp. JEL0065]
MDAEDDDQQDHQKDDSRPAGSSNQQGDENNEEQESVYSEGDYLGPLSDEEDDAPKRKSTVLVNRNAGFVRIRRLYEGEKQVVSRRASMVPGFIIHEEDEEDDMESSSDIHTPIRSKSVKSPSSSAGKRGGSAKQQKRRESSVAQPPTNWQPGTRPSVIARRPHKGFYDITTAQAQEIRDVFDLFDTDGETFQPILLNPSYNVSSSLTGSASIDPSELRIVMRALGFNLTQGEVLEITKWFDKGEDEDQALSFEEFLYVMAVKLSQKDETAEIKASFALFDVDKRGKIGMRELRKVARDLGDSLTDEDVLMMIQENDFDGDGELGESDWAKIFQAAKSAI